METKLAFKVTADSVEEFEEICEKIDKLPQSVKSQIYLVEKSLCGIDCKIKCFNTSNEYYLPSNVNKIKYFDDFVGIYTDDILFRIYADDRNRAGYTIVKE